MDAERYSHDLDYARDSAKRMQYIVLAMAAVTLLSVLNTLMQYGRDRTVITPPAIEKSFWVTSSTASPEYVEQMALWISGLILDVTPDNIDYKSNLLLQFTHPSAHGRLQEQQVIESKRIKRDNAATYFVLQTVRSRPEKLSALIRGRFHTLINGNHVSDQEKNYLVRFRVDGGRAQLIEFREVLHAELDKLLETLD